MNLYDRIIEAYQETGSVKLTAERLGTYPIKVRRVLISERLWSSRTSNAVGELHKQGKSTSEIAAALCMSEKNVQSYLPYERGMYGREKSDNATRSEIYRERNKKAYESQVINQHPSDADRKEPREMGKIINLEDYQKNSRGFLEKTKTAPALKKDMGIADSIWNMISDLDVLRLKLELVNHGETPGDLEILRQYAKAERGISREVLVPGRMTLHAMHYMIQKLFGWQNSHLHHFELPEHVFRGLTKDSARAWSELCGVLFRFPEGDDVSDLYWDDDYDQHVSVKTWLKRKYSGGDWETFSVGDCYLDNVRKVEEFEGWVNSNQLGRRIFGGREYADLSLEDLRSLADIGLETNRLAERIELGEILYEKGKGGLREDPKQAGEAIAFLRGEFEEMLEQDMSAEELDYYASAANTLRTLRSNHQKIDRFFHIDPERARKELGEDPQAAKMEYELAIEQVQEECLEYINDWNPDIVPVCDELSYFYDYGDGWEVRITCEEGFRADWENDDYDYDGAGEQETLEHILSIDEELVFYDSDGRKVSDEMQNTLEEIQYLQKPLCVAADGLNVMDDVGGFGGYLEFLETIHGTDRQAAANMRDWARWMGWTGRKSKPENML